MFGFLSITIMLLSGSFLNCPFSFCLMSVTINLQSQSKRINDKNKEKDVVAAHITLISILWRQRETEIPLVPQSTEDTRKNIPAKSNLCLRTRRTIVADSQTPQNQRGSTQEADTLFKIQLTALLFDKVFSSSSIR